jgi:formate dehydrogenase assembly factor FdhD
VRIRHYGILSSTAKGGKFENVKALLKVRVRKRKKKPVPERKVYNPNVCSVCNKESMVRILDFDPFDKLRTSHRGPPASMLQTLSKQFEKINENTRCEKAS